MVNPDNDLSESSINQDYFAVAMTSFAILVGRTLAFSPGDNLYDISCIDKIKQALRIAKNMEYISESVYYWLIYLLNLSEAKESTNIIKKINEIEILNIDMSEVDFNVSCYDFKKESEKIAHFIYPKILIAQVVFYLQMNLENLLTRYLFSTDCLVI